LQKQLKVSLSNRADLKPMQPMRLHWAPRLWGPHASGGPAPLGSPRHVFG